jgi:hypothetical protein
MLTRNSFVYNLISARDVQKNYLRSNLYMMDIGIGTAAGVAASTATHVLHNETDKEDRMEIALKELCTVLHLLHQKLSLDLQDKELVEEHVTVPIYPSYGTPVRRRGYDGFYILVASASTFTVTVSGLSSFVWTPNVGVYNRWKFPEGTLIQLLTPANPSYPVDFLYTNDLTV